MMRTSTEPKAKPVSQSFRSGFGYWQVGNKLFPRSSTPLWVEVKDGWEINLFDGKCKRSAVAA